MSPPNSNYFAVAAWGLEGVAAQELAELGAADVRPVVGGVHFSGDLRLLYRANLSLRTVTRIIQPLREFAAASAEMLYSQVRRVRWESYLNPTRTLCVHATLQGGGVRIKGAPPERGARGRKPERGAEQGINHSKFAALKIKDAIVDRLRHEQGARPNIDLDDPDIRVHAHFSAGRCTLGLDSSGASLHERGYRLATTGAPLKETLAAGVVALSGWNETAPFYDPLCGAGTLVIEAALQARRIAPGSLGRRFGFERWPDFDAALWEAVQAEARAGVRSIPAGLLIGSDRDPQAIAAARANAERAGVAGDVTFFVANAVTAPPPAAGPGRLVVNPPYGERLGDEAEVGELYERLAAHWQSQYAGWTACVLAGNLTLARRFPLESTRKTKLLNGALECRLLEFPL